jgi:hypothetical protein
MAKTSRVEPFAPMAAKIHMRTVLAKNTGMSIAALDRAEIIIRGNGEGDKVSLRRQISRFLMISGWDYKVELLNCMLSIVACCMYVWETYDNITYYSEMRLVEALCSIVFIFDYFARLLLAEQRLVHIFSREALIDLVTISPVFFTNLDADVMFIRVLRVVRVVRVLRILRVSKLITSGIESEVSQEIASLILSLISAAFFAAGIIHQVDNMHREIYWLPLLDFHDALYFVVVTFSTVGYGDIAPESDITKGEWYSSSSHAPHFVSVMCLLNLNATSISLILSYNPNPFAFVLSQHKPNATAHHRPGAIHDRRGAGIDS